MESEQLSPEELEAGRLLFARECKFVLGAVQLEQVPYTELVEVCFAGRSNVGKSSLINALTGRKNIARTSSTPGRTQELNFFNMDDRLSFCDLPGYGYAKAPVSKVKQWQEVIFAYLCGRPQLRRVFVLIDSRHGIKDTDRPVFEMMDKAAVAFQVILTKADKIKVGGQKRVLEETRAELVKHPAAHPDVLLTSSEKGIGIAEVRGTIAKLIDPLQN